MSRHGADAWVYDVANLVGYNDERDVKIVSRNWTFGISDSNIKIPGCFILLSQFQINFHLVAEQTLYSIPNFVYLYIYIQGM